MVRQDIVPITASCGVDITVTIGFVSKSSTVISTRATPINRITVFPIPSATRFLSLLPIACPMLTVVPMASPTSITVIICMTCEPMDTAVVLATPSNCPMINKSAIPYNVCKK